MLVPYTEMSCYVEDVAVKMNIHANRSTACVRLEKRNAGMHSRLAARTWMPCSRSTAVRDDSLVPTWAVGMVRKRISFQGACPASALTMFV
jgi:hypothetical protein